MISIDEAKEIIQKRLSGCVIEKLLLHKGLYVACVALPDSLEGDMDPFYSVNMQNGEFKDFPILLPENEAVFMAFCAGKAV